MLRVLIIDDNPADRLLLQKRIARAADDYDELEVIEAESILAGVRALKMHEDIGLIVLDLTLPDSLGPEDTFDRIYADSREAPVVVLSSLDDKELAVRIMRAGAADFRHKNEINDDVVARILLESIKRQKRLVKLGQKPATISDIDRVRNTITKSGDSGEMSAVTNADAHLASLDTAKRTLATVLKTAERVASMAPVLDRLDRVVIRDTDSVLVRLAKSDERERLRTKPTTPRPPSVPQPMAGKTWARIVVALITLIGTLVAALLKGTQ